MAFDYDYKINTIERFVIKAKGRYIKIESEAVDCVYDLYEIIIGSTTKNVIRNISNYDGFARNKNHLSTIYMYIGFFCIKGLALSDITYQLANCYNKLAIEAGNAISMLNIARNYKNNCQHQKALKYFKLALANKDSLPCDVNYFYSDIGDIYYSMNNFDLAINFYKLQLKIDALYQFNFLEKLATSYFNCKNYRKAIKYFYMTYHSRVRTKNYICDKIANCYYMDVTNNVEVKYKLETLIQDGNFIRGVNKAIALIYYKKKDYDISLKYYKLLYVHEKDKLVKKKCIVFSEMNDNIKSLKYFKKLTETTVATKVSGSKLLDEEYGLIFRSNKNYDSLAHFYLFNRNSIGALELLCGSSSNLQDSTIDKIINYFNNEPSALCEIISHIIKPKIRLLNLHFEFAINSDAYETTKANFYKMANNDE